MDSVALVQARTLLWSHGCPSHNRAVIEQAELIVWELVTTAVERGTPPLLLRVECMAASGLQVLVGEGSAQANSISAGGEGDGGWGDRGLALVDLLSDAWGVHNADETTEVWFRLAPIAR